MRILITGGNGGLGKTMTEYLMWYDQEIYATQIFTVENGFKGLNVVNFIKGQEDYILRTQDIDICYHFAGNPIVKCAPHEEEQLHLDNIILTQKLLSECKRTTKFVFISSATVYGNYSEPPNEESKLNPRSIYAGTKAAAEQIVRGYTAQKALMTYIIRPCAVVTRWATHGLLFDILRKLDSDSVYLELLGEYPGSKKPYMYGPRFCDLLHATITQEYGYHPVERNYAPKDSIDVEDVANIVMDEYGIRKPIRFMGEAANWKGDDNFVQLNSLYTHYLPSSKEAIRKTVKDILDARLER